MDRKPTARVKTPADVRGAHDLKPLERTTATVLQTRMEPRSVRHLKHCHSLKGSRHVERIDRLPWEERVADNLQRAERHRYERANALHHAMGRVSALLALTRAREEKLKLTAAQLEHTTAYLLTIMDAMADMLLATNEGGRITEANRAACQMTGLDRESLMGRPVPSLFSDQIGATNMVRRTFVDGSMADVELELTGPGGEPMPLLCNATVLLDEQDQPTGVLINARDMSELKKAQESRERYAEQLARANEDLEEFASVASHDLQEPMKRVAIYTQRVMDRLSGEVADDVREELGYVLKQATHMQEMIKQVLAYARVDHELGDFGEVDCEQVLDQVLLNLHGALDVSGVRISREPLPTLRADPLQLGRVMQNLLGNAIKYRDDAKPEQTVHISARRTETATARLPQGARAPGWLFTVVDNGIGVNEEFVEDIFKMFIRLHSADEVEGAGMGLAIVWKIVQRHGGVAWMESEEFESSTFYFTIPDGEPE